LPVTASKVISLSIFPQLKPQPTIASNSHLPSFLESPNQTAPHRPISSRCHTSVTLVPASLFLRNKRWSSDKPHLHLGLTKRAPVVPLCTGVGGQHDSDERITLLDDSRYASRGGIVPSPSPRLCSPALNPANERHLVRSLSLHFDPVFPPSLAQQAVPSSCPTSLSLRRGVSS
jgi:hypothetical protein